MARRKRGRAAFQVRGRTSPALARVAWRLPGWTIGAALTSTGAKPPAKLRGARRRSRRRPPRSWHTTALSRSSHAASPPRTIAARASRHRGPIRVRGAESRRATASRAPGALRRGAAAAPRHRSPRRTRPPSSLVASPARMLRTFVARATPARLQKRAHGARAQRDNASLAEEQCAQQTFSRRPRRPIRHPRPRLGPRLHLRSLRRLRP
mmetsp:Transcript_87543/g.282908  ORF Transcript_87543/g.282908 Transcript_87543/m.282908 type:complete len:209 (-) Transcript_87543:1289-1915(-)